MKLKVYPNPFTALGPHGMPCGRALVDPAHPRPLDIVGGKLRKVRVAREETEAQKRAEKAKNLDARDSRVSGVADVRMRPIEVPNTQYYRERIACGDLIVADKQSARLAGLAPKDFRRPLAVLSAALQARVEAWRAINGARPAAAAWTLSMDGDEIKFLAPKAPAEPGEAPSKVIDAPFGKRVGPAGTAGPRPGQNDPGAPLKAKKPAAPKPPAATPAATP